MHTSQAAVPCLKKNDNTVLLFAKIIGHVNSVIKRVSMSMCVFAARLHNEENPISAEYGDAKSYSSIS